MDEKPRVEWPWPYNLPIWRTSYRAQSPDGRYVAEINPAMEVSMGNPTYGTLCLSAGLHLAHCNPSFVWSDDSRYLAVPQYFMRLATFRRQRLLVIDVVKRCVFWSSQTAFYFQPESFVDGRLVVTKEPFKPIYSRQMIWQIPQDLDTKFTRRFSIWSRQPT